MPRPHTFINVATSIDGRITTRDRALHGFGGDEDRALMEDLRTLADAVLIGAGTLRDEDPLLTIRSPERIARRQGEGRSSQPLAVILSRSLEFAVESSRFFNTEGFDRLVLTGDSAHADARERLASRAEVVPVPESPGGAGLDLAAAVGVLHDRGIQRLLLEGGGRLNFAMLAAGLVDEVYLTLCPFVFGGDDAPAAFAGEGFTRDGVQGLELVESRPGEAGRIFLRYRVVPRS